MKSCDGCKFFAPTTPKKIEIVVGYFQTMEKLNDKLMEDNRRLLEKIDQLKEEKEMLIREISEVNEKLSTRNKILNISKGYRGRHFILSVLTLKKKQPVKPVRRQSTQKKNWDLWKEWDEIRMLINPNARR